MTASRLIRAGMALAGVTGATVARGKIEFAGYLAVEAETKVMLADTTTGRTSDWLGVGGNFGGYTVRRLAVAEEVVWLEKDGQMAPLALKQPQAHAAPSQGILVTLDEQIELLTVKLLALLERERRLPDELRQHAARQINARATLTERVEQMAAMEKEIGEQSRQLRHERRRLNDERARLVNRRREMRGQSGGPERQ